MLSTAELCAYLARRGNSRYDGSLVGGVEQIIAARGLFGLQCVFRPLSVDGACCVDTCCGAFRHGCEV